MPTQDDLSMECNLNPKLAKIWSMGKVNAKHKQNILKKIKLYFVFAYWKWSKTLMSYFSFLELFISSQ